MMTYCLHGKLFLLASCNSRCPRHVLFGIVLSDMEERFVSGIVDFALHSGLFEKICLAKLAVYLLICLCFF